MKQYHLKFPLGLFLVITMGACKNQDGATKATKDDSPAPRPVAVVKVDATRQVTKPTINILALRISGDTAMVDVSYSGGCKPHQFDLYSSGMWMKSMPPKINIWLEHTVAESDPCRGLVKETLKFVINPLRYRGGDKVVVLMLGTELSADYVYPKK